MTILSHEYSLDHGLANTDHTKLPVFKNKLYWNIAMPTPLLIVPAHLNAPTTIGRVE